MKLKKENIGKILLIITAILAILDNIYFSYSISQISQLCNQFILLLVIISLILIEPIWFE